MLCIFIALFFFGGGAAGLCESQTTAMEFRKSIVNKSNSFFPHSLYFEPLSATHVMRMLKEILIVYIIAHPGLYN